MLDLRQRAEEIVKEVSRGRSMTLTYRGRPAIRLEPLRNSTTGAKGDAFYQLPALATRRGAPLDNREIDEILYGS